MNTRRILFAIIAGIVAVLLLSLYLKKEEAKVLGGAPVEILIAAQDIPREVPVKEEYLTARRFPRDFVHPHSILPSQKDIITGQPTRYALVKGQPILWSDIGKAEGGLSSKLNPGERAMSLNVSEAGGIAGNLRSNDRVDVLGTFEMSGKVITKVLMQNVTILGVGTVAPRSSSKEEADMNMISSLLGGPYSCVTVAVTPEEAQVLTLAQEKGTLSMTLRGSTDLDIYENLSEVELNSILRTEKKLTSQRKERTEIIRGGVAE